MNNYTRAFVISVAGILLAPGLALAGSKNQTFLCGAAHHLRVGGTEIRSTAINFRNIDLENPAVIERITIRNTHGAIVHDSGPAAGVPHPLNTDYAAPLDITVVPPGGSYYLRTGHIWGNNALPITAGSGEAGQSMSAVVEVSKEGKKKLFSVGTRARARDRVVSPTGVASEGAERSSNSGDCELID